MLVAITREVSPAISGCELTHLSREPIDIALARAQHDAYCAALTSLGCRVVNLPAEPDLPDSVFVEDVTLVFDEVAVMTRPGAESRRTEGIAVANALGEYRELVAIETPATLDGGDVLRIGREIYVGVSGRSNSEGIDQLRILLSKYGYSVHPVPISGCLHLKSAVTAVADDTVLLNPQWVSREAFACYKILEIDPREPHAANTLRVGGTLIYPDCFPFTQQRLIDAGFKVRTVDVSELQKAEGAVTCCSLLFDDGQGQAHS